MASRVIGAQNVERDIFYADLSSPPLDEAEARDCMRRCPISCNHRCNTILYVNHNGGMDGADFLDDLETCLGECPKFCRSRCRENPVIFCEQTTCSSINKCSEQCDESFSLNQLGGILDVTESYPQYLLCKQDCNKQCLVACKEDPPVVVCKGNCPARCSKKCFSALPPPEDILPHDVDLFASCQITCPLICESECDEDF